MRTPPRLHPLWILASGIFLLGTSVQAAGGALWGRAIVKRALGRSLQRSGIGLQKASAKGLGKTFSSQGRGLKQAAQRELKAGRRTPAAAAAAPAAAPSRPRAAAPRSAQAGEESLPPMLQPGGFFSPNVAKWGTRIGVTSLATVGVVLGMDSLAKQEQSQEAKPKASSSPPPPRTASRQASPPRRASAPRPPASSPKALPTGNQALAQREAQTARQIDRAVDQALTKPPPAPKASRPAPSRFLDLPIRHRVAGNDSFWSLAQRYCGAGSRWQEIFRANRGKPGVSANPNQVADGAELNIPCAKARVRLKPPASPQVDRQQVLAAAEAERARNQAYRAVRVKWTDEVRIGADVETTRRQTQAAQRTFDACWIPGTCLEEKVRLAEAKRDLAAQEKLLAAVRRERAQLQKDFLAKNQAWKNSKARQPSPESPWLASGRLSAKTELEQRIAGVEATLRNLSRRHQHLLPRTKKLAQLRNQAYQARHEAEVSLGTCRKSWLPGSCTKQEEALRGARTRAQRAEALARHDGSRLAANQANLELSAKKLEELVAARESLLGRRS